jgi:penicillin amidase
MSSEFEVFMRDVRQATKQTTMRDYANPQSFQSRTVGACHREMQHAIALSRAGGLDFPAASRKRLRSMTRPYRFLRNILAAILVLAGVALLAAWWIVRRPLPALDGTLSVPGLKAGVIVDRDQWGRPWIRANSVEDLVMAQGYVMAQDRLWQMDLLRRASSGELSEIFGSVALDFDKENRTLGMREAAERAVGDASPEIRGLLEAYAAGVNQYIEQRQGRLPIEFTLLRYKPSAWTPADTFLISLYMYKTLTSTWKSKLNRQWVMEKAGPERSRLLFNEDSPLDIPVVGTLPPGAIPARKTMGEQQHSSVSSQPASPAARGASAAGGSAPPFPRETWDTARGFLAQFEEESREIIGSNNFAVSGARTASGKPLLANDTHLSLGVPCIWYLVHLTAPGWNVQGFALPGAPLVIIGHNNRIAWGFTNSNADVEDLYAETFDTYDPLSYRVNGKWQTAEVRHETIHVRGGADVGVDVVATRHGPIVYREAPSEGGHVYSLRWTALEPGGLDFGFPLLGRARNWDEFVETTKHIAGPGQNAVYCDVDGNIGFTIPAKIPIRAKGNGALPVPGDTDEFEWKGYIPFEELPRVENPPGGIIVTANARTVGAAYKYYLTDRWAGPYRTHRIHDLLVGRTNLTPSDFNAIQNDIFSIPNDFLAKQLVAAAQSKGPKDPRTRGIIQGLAMWNGKATTGSVETSFLEFTRHALLHRLLAPILGDATSKYELWEPGSIYNDVWWRDKEFLAGVLKSRPAAWLPSGFASYDDLLLASADDAVAQLEKKTQSPIPADWGWGRLHTLDLAHPMGRYGFLHRPLSIGPYEQGGTIDTVRAMGIGDTGAPGAGHGPAMRFVADLSNLDGSLMEITTGESGQYGSAYYRDQFPEWFEGRGIPAPFSESAENASRVHHLVLMPEHH